MLSFKIFFFLSVMLVPRIAHKALEKPADEIPAESNCEQEKRDEVLIREVVEKNLLPDIAKQVKFHSSSVLSTCGNPCALPKNYPEEKKRYEDESWRRQTEKRS